MSVANLVPPYTVGELVLSPTLLAAVRPQMRSSSDSSMVVWIVGGVGLLVMLVVGLSLLNRVLHRRQRTSQSGLFAALCALHGLPRGSRRLLKQVAAAGRLAIPARLFTEPQWLEASARSPQFQARATELTALRDRLFGTSE